MNELLERAASRLHPDVAGLVEEGQRRGRSRVRRVRVVKSVSASVVAAVAIAGVGVGVHVVSAPGADENEIPAVKPDTAAGGLSSTEIREAVAAAQQIAENEQATITSASVQSRTGTVPQPNTGHPCNSGQLLVVRIIGTFPHTSVSGHPQASNAPYEDMSVTGAEVTVDARSGHTCLIGALTGDVQPFATPLDLN